MARPHLAALLVLAACGGNTPTPTPTPAEPAPIAAAPAEPRPGEPFLLDPGAEPRHALRYQAPNGTVRDAEMTMAMTMNVGGHTIVTPPMVFGGIVEVIDASSDGSHTQRWTYQRADVHPTPTSDEATVATLRASLKHLEGLAMRMPVGPRGHTDGVVWEASNPTPEQEAVMAATPTNSVNLITVLPDAAIGVGARWTLDGQMTNGNVLMQVHTAVEVVDITTTRVHLRGTIDFKVPRQDMATAAGPVPVEGAGSGTLEATVDVTTLESTYVSGMRILLEMEGTDPPTTIDMSMNVSTRLY